MPGVNEVTRLTSRELNQLMGSGRVPVIVDSRASDVYDKEHIRNAINIQYDVTADPFERQTRLSGLPTDRLLVIYCD
jgi:rhodanese-related sulfurtransferase